MKFFKILLISLFCLNLVSAQVRTTIELHKIAGFGPQGTVFQSLPQIEQSAYKDLFPKTQNVPETWTDVRNYYHLLNEGQYFYQAYKRGKLTKSQFVDFFSKKKLQLQDTLNFTDKSINCGVSIAVGLDKKTNTYCYIIDKNMNNDYGDDVVKKIDRNNSLLQSKVVTDNVYYEYHYNNSIVKDSSVLQLSLSEDNSVYISSPQYYLGTITLNNKSYFLCKNSGITGAYFLPALPYFNQISPDKRILSGQYFTIDGLQFTLKNVLYDGKFMEIDGPIALKNQPTFFPKETHIEKTSAQVGYKAPSFSGINALDGTRWSLDNIKDKWVYIYFWSTTCTPCIQDLKNLTAISNKYKDKIQFIGICDVRSDLTTLLSDHKVNWPTLTLQEMQIKSLDYDIYKYPTSFLLNKDHIVEKIDLRSSDLQRYFE